MSEMDNLFLTSLLGGLGILFMGKYIGKKFDLSANSYLGFAIISFVLIFISQTKGQDILLKFFVNFPIIDRATIVRFVIGLCAIAFLLIWFAEGRKRSTPLFSLYRNIYRYYASVKKCVDMYDVSRMQNRFRTQNKRLEELEEYLELGYKNIPKGVSNKAIVLKQKLIEVISVLSLNSHRSDQTKKYEVWKNIKFNVMENEVKPLYDQLKKDLIT
jgi:hypothetical protein